MIKSGYINKIQYESYIELWKRISDLLKDPDIIAFIDYPVEYSLAHLESDEIHGIRPKEFPSEEMKSKWITGWHAEYQNYLDNLPEHLRQRVMVCNHPDDIEAFSDMIIQKTTFLRS